MGKEAKANAERGYEKIPVDWRAIPLTVHRGDKAQLAAIDAFGELPSGESADELRERVEGVLHVRAAKQAVLAYVTAGTNARLSGRDAKEYLGPLRDDLETDEPESVMLRRHLDWAMRWLGNDELAVPSSCAGWREPVHDYFKALLSAPIEPASETSEA